MTDKVYSWEEIETYIKNKVRNPEDYLYTPLTYWDGLTARQVYDDTTDDYSRDLMGFFKRMLG